MSTLRPGHLYFLNGRVLGPALIRTRSYRFLIGRNPGNHLVLEVPEAEPLHCKIYRSENTIVIRNCSKRNPIRLNGLQMLDERPILHGDLIEVAGFVFMWQYKVKYSQRVRWIEADDECDLPSDRIKVYLCRDAKNVVWIRYVGRGCPPATVGEERIVYSQEELMDEETLITQMAEKGSGQEETQEQQNVHTGKLDVDGENQLLPADATGHEQTLDDAYSDLEFFDSYEYMQNQIKNGSDLTEQGSVAEEIPGKVDVPCGAQNEKIEEYQSLLADAKDVEEVDDHQGFVPPWTDYEEFEYVEAELETNTDYDSINEETDDADDTPPEEFENVYLDHKEDEQQDIQQKNGDPVTNKASTAPQGEFVDFTLDRQPAIKSEESDEVECEEYVVQSYSTEPSSDD